MTLELTLLVALAAALVLGAIAHRLGVPPMIGYVAAGLAVGPFTPGLVAEQEDVLALDGGKDPALRVEEPRGCGQKGDVLQIGPIQRVKLFEVAHAQRGRDCIDVSGTDL